MLEFVSRLTTLSYLPACCLCCFCLFVCLFCLFVCLFVWLFVCLFCSVVCLFVCLFVCLIVLLCCLFVCFVLFFFTSFFVLECIGVGMCVLGVEYALSSLRCVLNLLSLLNVC